MSSAYCIDNTNLLQEVIDGDVIMINLASNKYYTLNKSGAFIWSLIGQGCGLPTIVNLVAKQCNVASKSIKAQVKAFVDMLLAEQLIVENGVAVNKSPVLPAGIVLGMSFFAEPLLNKFHDMQMLLAN